MKLIADDYIEVECPHCHAANTCESGSSQKGCWYTCCKCNRGFVLKATTEPDIAGCYQGSPRRPTSEEYFMWIAFIASTRSTCDRRSVGCVIVDTNGRILATGYNGSAPGAPHCDHVGHLYHDEHCIRTTHAEANAIGHSARAGISLGGSIAYVTCHPCPECLKLLIAAGVTEVFFNEEYHTRDDVVSSKLAEGNLILTQYTGSQPWITGCV